LCFFEVCKTSFIVGYFIIQKVVRGHLTRNKLREAKELYESIFNELEEDGDNFEVYFLKISILRPSF